MNLVILLLPLLPADDGLSPASWDGGVLDALMAANATFEAPFEEAVEGTRGLVVGTTGPPAVHAGRRALDAGGSAVDAALTTALTQVCLAGGSWVSYAGILTAVVYDAETGRVTSVNAAYDTVRGEDDPMTIPDAAALADRTSNLRRGRTVLVPGFLAGVDELHRRFGRLERERLFAPAIWFAEEGFEVSAPLAAMIRSRKDVLSRYVHTKAIFTRESGDWLEAGDVLRQPALAKTLRTVATEGTDLIYRGEWARKLVATARAEFGKLSLEDLAEYRPIVDEAVVADVLGHAMHAHGLPATGGMHLAEGFGLAKHAGLLEPGRTWRDDPETLVWLARVASAPVLSYLPNDSLRAMAPDLDLSHASRATAATADALFALIRDRKIPFLKPPLGTHSDAVIAVDERGNVCALVHSINTASWGSVGMFVDGISIPDSASFQQLQIAEAGPGKRLPDPTNPTLFLKDGKPVLASSSIGGGLHERTFASLLDVLVHGKTPQEAIDAKPLVLSWGELGDRALLAEEGTHDEDFLDESEDLGLNIDRIEPNDNRLRGSLGYWIGVAIDPETGKRSAGAPRLLNGGASAQR